MTTLGVVYVNPRIRYVNGKLVEVRACSYCWATFSKKRSTQYHCSPACSKRDSAWNGWVSKTRKAAALGRRTPALPPDGMTLAGAIAPFNQALQEGNK